MKLENVVIRNERGYCRADVEMEGGRICGVEVLDDGGWEKSDFYVTPGFVNAHLHPNQLMDRRMLDEMGISQLLDGMHGSYKKTDGERYAQALLVLMESIKAGATCAYSVASSPGPVIEAYKRFGMKGAVTCFYNDQWEGYGAPPAMSLLHGIEEGFGRLVGAGDGRFGVHIGSASVESASNDLLVLIDDLARRHGSRVNIHVSEGQDCVHSCFNLRRRTPVRLLGDLGILGPRWNLIHAVTLEAEEIELIAKSGASVIHCPVSNAKTGVGVAPIMDLMRRGVRIALGSDACSNNNTNNVLNEAYFASLIHAAVGKNAKAVAVETVMGWLTSGGHDIIGTGQKGKIEVGEPADLLLWSLHESPFVPVAYGRFDAALIYNAPDIKPHTVLIDGKPVVENYKFTLHAEKDIRDEANLCGFKMHSFKRGL